MFVVRNRLRYGQKCIRHTGKAALGSHMDESSTAYLLLVNRRFRSELPSFINILNFFKMRNRRSVRKAPGKSVLSAIKSELKTLCPGITCLKVKPYYNNGLVTAHADFGSRRVHVVCSTSTVVEKFILKYNDRFPSSSIHIKTLSI